MSHYRTPAALVRGIDNIQTLYGLPYTPPPLITVWLPWVELVLGGTELVLENFIWVRVYWRGLACGG